MYKLWLEQNHSRNVLDHHAKSIYILPTSCHNSEQIPLLTTKAFRRKNFALKISILLRRAVDIANLMNFAVVLVLTFTEWQYKDFNKMIYYITRII